MARVAIPLGEGFEDSEYEVPRQRLEEAGHTCVVVGSSRGAKVTGKRGRVEAEVEQAASEADPAAFDALLVPGGWSPDRLRTDPEVVAFVRRVVEAGRPVAAICHGPQLLIEAEVVSGRTLTSYASVRKDLENAGATWKDEAVIVDGALVTSRTPDDLDPFCKAFLEQLGSP